MSKSYGLWKVSPEPGQKRRYLASTDLATLVYAVALERYAKAGGFVGLLMPKAIVTADPGNRAFRRFHLRTDSADEYEVGGAVDHRFAPIHLDDWSNVQPFAPDAANTPVFLVCRTADSSALLVAEGPAGGSTSFSVPTVKWGRRGGRLPRGSWYAVQPGLIETDGTSKPISSQTPASAWSFQASGLPPLIEGGSNAWDFGTGLHTRGANGIYFVSILDASPGRLLIENRPLEGKNAKIKVRRGWVEAGLVYPLLRGRDVSRWLASPSSYVVLPYSPQHLGQLLAEDDWSAFPDARTWLRNFRGVLRERKPPPARKWDLDGDDWCRVDGPIQHMGKAHTVVVREQATRPSAAVVASRYDKLLGRTAVPIVDHKLVFCAVDSEDEATYLMTVINSTPMQDLLGSFSNSIAVAPLTLSRLPIPAFDQIAHAEVAAAGREAAAAAAKGSVPPALELAVDAAVSKMMDLGTSYQGQPRPKRKPLRRRGAAASQSDLFNDPPQDS